MPMKSRSQLVSPLQYRLPDGRMIPIDDDPVDPGRFWCNSCRCWFDDEQSFRDHLSCRMMPRGIIDFDVASQRAKW